MIYVEMDYHNFNYCSGMTFIKIYDAKFPTCMLFGNLQLVGSRLRTLVSRSPSPLDYEEQAEEDTVGTGSCSETSSKTSSASAKNEAY